ncbi:DNA repair ATPase [Thalassomonas viridans]|uniref:DNA repair ATPase n=1 Tax=Thalassomonas viridans TaxID=137584 RepID=A0AAE9YZM9_9GAMM|nr:DNA repair ATPase [Thalassomonas viridans]WDE04101.1 DNA repair ATPase [Thalassomonas viridans]
MSQKAKKDFIFKKHMSIGEVDAENDQKFLKNCFVDNGDYEVLEDTESPQSIIVGRTGVGKSALISHLINNSQHKIIEIEPEELALKHISNSTILTFFESLGVNLDIFYNLLWQHTFAVELIKSRYSITDESQKRTFFTKIEQLISGNIRKKEALDYLENWGESFWVSTELRIKEFTEKLESSLKAGLKTKLGNIDLSSDSTNKLTEEQKSEIIHYGKKVVNDVQIKKLSKIINLLADDIFNDPQRKYFIVIDRLDEKWVEDDLRYKLIRALIESIKKFRKIETVKIIITLRKDLLGRVIEKTRDSGFQLEKYKTLFLNIGWDKSQLYQLIDKRINKLLKYKYISSEVSFEDVFPSRMDKVSALDYILDRTLLRPRDAVMFINECLSEAQNKTEITSSIIKSAEKSYSLERKESLEYEWFVEHKHLKVYIDILHDRKKNFKVSEIKKEELEQIILQISEDKSAYADDVITTSQLYLNSEYPQNDTYLRMLKQKLLFTLYKVGIIGIKTTGTSSVKWIHDKTQDITYQKIENSSVIYIHKMLWRTLAIDTR